MASKTAKISGISEIVDVAKCQEECKACIRGDQGADCHRCTKGRLGRRSATGWWEKKTRGDVVVYTYFCSPEGSYYLGSDAYLQKCPPCLSGEVMVCTADECTDPAFSDCCGCREKSCTEQRRPWRCPAAAEDAPAAASCDNNQAVLIGEVRTAHDPNQKAGPPGDVVRGQTLSYTIDYENTGEAAAQGVFLTDELSASLDDQTLVIENGGTYAGATRMLSWSIGDLAVGGKGQVAFSVEVRADATLGAQVANVAKVFFPSVPEVTSTNAVVSTVRAVVAEPQQVSVVEGGSVPIMLGGRDPAGLTLSYTVTEGPSNGTLSGSAPQLTYTPGAGYEGPDSFAFAVSNGLTTSEPATVEIVVTPSMADQTPPRVVLVEPANGAVGVALPVDSTSTIARACFDEPIDPASVIGANVRLSGAGQAVATERLHDQALSCISMLPAATLSNGTSYVATIGRDLKDTSGNALGADYSWGFETVEAGAAATVAPTAVDFCLIAVRSASPAQSVAVTNPGASGLAVTGVTLEGTDAGDFAVASDECSSGELIGRGTCRVGVTFAPRTAGAKTATLKVSSTAVTLQVVLSGIGGTAALRFASDTIRVSESAGSVVVGVSRVGSAEAALEASYATADETAVAGSDYVASSGTVTLAAGETEKSITVSQVNDGVQEVDETFRVTLSGSAVCGGAPAAARVLVADDDVPAVILLTPVGLAAAGGALLLLRRARRPRRARRLRAA
ncbi:MAG: Ig-like domain-containing protein [Candidatus Schekmanbacteria bacterium]|nr:Ig-like domain-containing protein [Candidatus Schekmanbacteria bacterium]